MGDASDVPGQLAVWRRSFDAFNNFSRCNNAVLYCRKAIDNAIGCGEESFVQNCFPTLTLAVYKVRP
jgi:hypothetical protein